MNIQEILAARQPGQRLQLRKANLSGADLSGADLSGADLSGADLSGADLSGANLRVANLSGADLSGATLSGADLSGANLSGANLHRADLIVAGQDSRGYLFYAYSDEQGAVIVRAGCRHFPLQEARAHWEACHREDPILHADCLSLVARIETLAKVRGWLAIKEI